MSASLIELSPHPVSPDQGVERLSLRVSRQGDALALVFALRGDSAQWRLPSTLGGTRRDRLWQRTCFEVFLRKADQDAYVEYNFAPNGDWAAYHFDTYRGEHRDVDTRAPQIKTALVSDGLDVLVYIPALPSDLGFQDLMLGPSAILEGRDGQRSYWALHHPLNKPDFHHIENFKISLD